jgi:hypothetical protein
MAHQRLEGQLTNDNRYMQLSGALIGSHFYILPVDSHIYCLDKLPIPWADIDSIYLITQGMR